MSVSRIGLRAAAVAAATLALLVGLAAPASAATGPGSAPYLAADSAAAEALGFDELADDLEVIKLRCRGHVADTGPVTNCAWRTDAPDVATFQLWRLQLDVDDAARVLVTEVGVDTHAAADTGVVAPAIYLYAVLGLDADGQVVARSRADRVSLRDPSIEHLRLACDKVTDAVPATDTEPAVAPSIGCTWSPAEEAEVRAYHLYRVVHGEDRVLIATVGADVVSYLDTSVEAGVRYRYRVEGVDEAGETVARSRFDGAGCPKPDRTDRDRDRAHDRSDRKQRGADDATGDGDESVDTLTAVADETDADRDDSETRPDRDRRDRRGRGR